MLCRSLLLPALVATVLAFCTPTAAHAETLRLRDPYGDTFRDDTPRREGGITGAPRQRRADIGAVVVRHTRARVIVRARLAALARRGDGTGMSLRMRTDEGVWRAVRLGAGPGEEGGWDGDVAVSRRNGREVSCATSHRVDHRADVLVVRLPRRCLRNPRWVRATVVTWYAAHGSATVFYDNGLHDRRNFATWTARVRRG